MNWRPEVTAVRYRWGPSLAFFVVAAWAATAHTQVKAPEAPSIAAKVDAVFARWDSTSTPGCAVGVAQRGAVVFEKGYGMADLEHDAVIGPATIFEAGSVSKQFTAAAVLLLARDGTLSLDDSIRKHFPELPAWAEPVTIRHMLHHTSGLRDWGDIAMLSGWPRTTRIYRHADVLDIISRQTALNFTPGADWSYSNSGYNLAAMLVARVSGTSFAEFTKARLFEPLGLLSTSWRDDFTRIVRGRAIAYNEGEGRFVTVMPFENVHGNGGVLTTVGDLLRWNEHLQSARKGDQSLASELQVTGSLSNGRAHGYASGLFVGEYRGLREVSHGGATAGYRSYLARFPDQHLSVALLCNAGPVNADALAHQVADLYLGSALAPEPRVTAIPMADDELANLVGSYRGAKRGDMVSVVREKDGVRVENGPPLVAIAPGRLAYGGSVADVFPASGMPVMRIRVMASNGTEDTYERVTKATPTADQLVQFVGVYRTTEVDAELQVVLEEGALKIKRRPDRVAALRPLYADAFASPLGLVRFVRGSGGAVSYLSVGTGRAWDVRFARVAEPGPAAPGR